MRRVALVLAACLAILAETGLWAQEADLVVPANNPSVASQTVPRMIMFSGTLKDLTGKPLAGPVELNFAIYRDQSDAAPLWQESQTLNVDEQGHYTALLGAMQPEGLPVDLFTSGEARWLGLTAGRLPEQPRVLLVSVPYALKSQDAEMLGGKPASAYMLAAAAIASSQDPGAAGTPGPRGAATPELAAPGRPKSGAKPNLAGTGTQNYIPLWTDSAGTLGNSVMFQSGGKVGIGTATPLFGLDLLTGSGAGVQVKSSSSSQAALLRLTTGNSPGSGTSTADMQFVDGTQLSFRFLSAVGNVAGTRYNGFISYVDRDGTKLPVRFFTTDAGGTPQTGFYLSAGQTAGTGGNVGIGTITPAQKLDVAGNINSSGNVTATGSVTAASFTGSGAGLTGVNASGLAAGTYSNALTFSNPSNSFTGNGSGLTGVTTSGLAAGTYSNALTFSNASNSFTGDGSGLTNVAAATATTASGLSCTGCVGNTQLGVNYAASASHGGAATNALALNGLASSAFQPAGSYATLGPNTFTGTQTVNAQLNVGSTQINSSGLVTEYNGQTTAGPGLGAVVGVADAVNQTANISSTTFATPAGTGLYHLMAVLFVTTNPSGCSSNPSGHVQVIANTDSGDQLFYTSSTLAWPLNPVVALNAPIEVKGGTNVQYNVSWTAATGCTTTVGDYGVRIRLVAY